MKSAGTFIFIVSLTCLVTVHALSSAWGEGVRMRIAPYISKDAANRQKVATLLQSNPCPGDKESSFKCWETYYDDLILKHNSFIPLFDLKARYEGGGYARLFCHTLLHPIGAAAAKEYGSVAEAYAHGDTFCRAGYYHGVLEGIFGEGDEGGGQALLSNIDSICSRVEGKEKYSYTYFSCAHGIGHGLMAYFDHDLFASLEGCNKLSGEWEQSSCYGGVFMENVISDTEEEPSKYLRADDLHYPCNAVEERQKGQCYMMQTSHMLSVTKGDFSRVFQECASVDDTNRIWCYQSIGRDASGWSYGSGASAFMFCSLGATEEQRRECIVGAASDYIQSVSSEAALELCDMGDVRTQKVCRDRVEYQLKLL